jgi:hypothetical protein
VCMNGGFDFQWPFARTCKLQPVICRKLGTAQGSSSLPSESARLVVVVPDCGHEKVCSGKATANSSAPSFN